MIVDRTAIDAPGNIATCTFAVTIVGPALDNPPEIVCPMICGGCNGCPGAIVDSDPVART